MLSEGRKNLKKKKRTQKKMVIILFSLILIIIALQIAPNYKKQVKNSDINFIYNNVNITNNLTQDLLLQNEEIYISMMDIKNILDSNIILEEETGKIITVCDTKVTAIDTKLPSMEINSVEIQMQNAVKLQNEQYYIPISELENVYNIEAKYIEDTNLCIVNKKDTELVGAKVKKNTNVKIIKKSMSLTIEKLEKYEKIIILNKQDDGWMQILTNNGNIGYIKKNKILEEYYIRENMKEELKQIDETNITNISKLRKIKTPTLQQIKTYDGRASIIEKIVDEAILNTVKCLEVNYDKLKEQDEQIYNRFLLELEANLKDVGITLKK